MIVKLYSVPISHIYNMKIYEKSRPNGRLVISYGAGNGSRTHL